MHTDLLSFSLSLFLSSQPLIHCSYIRHCPMCGWEVCTSVTAHWEMVALFYIYHERQTQRWRDVLVVGKLLGIGGPEVKSRGEDLIGRGREGAGGEVTIIPEIAFLCTLLNFHCSCCFCFFIFSAMCLSRERVPACVQCFHRVPLQRFLNHFQLKSSVRQINMLNLRTHNLTPNYLLAKVFFSPAVVDGKKKMK